MANKTPIPIDFATREKRCTKCGETKPLTKFWRRFDRGPYSVRPKCMSCTNDPAYFAEYGRRNPRRRQDNKLRYYFGISVEQYEAMAAAQGGVCAICGKPERSKRYTRLCVDHCHETGVNRGLLCSHCNRAVGLLQDCPNTLRRAAEYLETWNKKKADALAA